MKNLVRRESFVMLCRKINKTALGAQRQNVGIFEVDKYIKLITCVNTAWLVMMQLKYSLDICMKYGMYL